MSRRSTRPNRTYRDHTQLRFLRREGMRIAVVLGSPALAARTGKGTSDGVPVVVELAD